MYFQLGRVKSQKFKGALLTMYIKSLIMKSFSVSQIGITGHHSKNTSIQTFLEILTDSAINYT